MRSSSSDLLVGGIDVGTQGMRVVVVDLAGRLRAHSAESFAASAGGSGEADPERWWAAACRCLRRVTRMIDPAALQALAVTSTSGTVVLLDARDRPLRPALMYSDRRAVAEAEHLNATLGSDAVQPSDPPAKLLWVRRHDPESWARTARVAHAADVLTARLTGTWATDWSHALKSGYDVVHMRWSRALETAGVSATLFPPVVPPGTVIGTAHASAADTGLAPGTSVVAGMTDGCTSQLAAGASAPGEWCSTLGTTLVLKGVTTARLSDASRGIYSHRHPDGLWMPGGASATGGECLRREFPDADLPAMDDLAASLTPTGLVAYPLIGSGERFPFVAPHAAGFLLGRPGSAAERYAAYLEGVAYVERLAYEVLAQLDAEVGDVIATAGGGARSRIWMQIRSDVLDRRLRRPVLPEAAAGAAILAAMPVTGESLQQRVRSMVHADWEAAPRPRLQGAYLANYNAFVSALVERGYLRR